MPINPNNSWIIWQETRRPAGGFTWRNAAE
jgi:hypothetical protein